MSERVTDFSTSIMRITWDGYSNLNDEQRELLRVYPRKSWEEDGILCFELASYRIDEILAAGK
jgi:hypothetical protein